MGMKSLLADLMEWKRSSKRMVQKHHICTTFSITITTGMSLKRTLKASTLIQGMPDVTRSNAARHPMVSADREARTSGRWGCQFIPADIFEMQVARDMPMS